MKKTKNHETLMLEGENRHKEKILELGRLCKIARKPEKLAEFIEKGISIEEAREQLIESLAERTEIISAIPAPSVSQESFVMREVKMRIENPKL